MRATTQRGALLEILGKVKPAATIRTALPVIQSILIYAGGGELLFTGTDLEVTLTGRCKANVTRKGAIVVPPKMLEAFLKAVKAETVTLSVVDKHKLKVEAGAVTTIAGFEAKEFPSLPRVRGNPVEVNGLAGALKQVSYCMAQDEARPALTGVFFASENGNLVLTASDGLRLAETKVKAKGELQQVIVPAKAVRLVEKLMSGKVMVHRSRQGRKGTSPSTISFVNNGLVLTAMAVETQFPDYRHVIPRNGSPLVVENKALRDALDVLSVTLPDNNCVHLNARRGTLVMSTKHDEKGETEVKVPAKGKAEIAFDARFLKDILAKTDRTIRLQTTGPRSPGLVKQNGTMHVLMPLFMPG